DPPQASTDDSLGQDLKAYKTEAQMNFLGVGGNILGDFTTPPPGLEAAIARSGHLKAAGKPGKTPFGGDAKEAGGPDKHTFGSKKDATLQKASDTFDTQFVAAISKAAKKGGTAPLGESDEPAANKFLMASLQSLFDKIMADADTSNAIDRGMRSKI